jgi:Uma2 family endonuclease
MGAMPEIAPPDQIHRYTPEEYEALEGHPSFDDRRVELIDGYIVDMSPRTPAHENVVRWLDRWFQLRIDGSRYVLGVAASLRIANSEPEPDIAVIDLERPKDIHPTGAHLVIEVTFSSLKRDMVVKPAIYAQAVTEYWVVNLHDRTVVVHRNPDRQGYRDVKVYPHDAAIAPEALGIEPMPFAELFAAA